MRWKRGTERFLAPSLRASLSVVEDEVVCGGGQDDYGGGYFGCRPYHLF